MLVSNPERFVIIPNIDEEAKFVIAHEAKENISPKETSAITSNGTHIISPSKGFTAMKYVEVDVEVESKGSVEYIQLTPSAINTINNATQGNLTLITIAERIKLDDGGSKLMIVTPLMTILTDSGVSGYKAIAINFDLKIAQYNGLTTIGDLLKQTSAGSMNWYNFLNSLPKLTEEEFLNLNK